MGGRDGLREGEKEGGREGGREEGREGGREGERVTRTSAAVSPTVGPHLPNIKVLSRFLTYKYNTCSPMRRWRAGCDERRLIIDRPQ